MCVLVVMFYDDIASMKHTVEADSRSTATVTDTDSAELELFHQEEKKIKNKGTD